MDRSTLDFFMVWTLSLLWITMINLDFDGCPEPKFQFAWLVGNNPAFGVFTLQSDPSVCLLTSNPSETPKSIQLNEILTQQYTWYIAFSQTEPVIGKIDPEVLVKIVQQAFGTILNGFLWLDVNKNPALMMSFYPSSKICFL